MIMIKLTKAESVPPGLSPDECGPAFNIPSR